MKTIVRFCILISLTAMTSCTQMGWEVQTNTIVRYSIRNETGKKLFFKNGESKEKNLYANNYITLYSKDRKVILPTPLLTPGNCNNKSFYGDPGLGGTVTVSDEKGNVMVVWHQDRVNDEPYSIYDSKNWEVTSPYEKYSNMKDYPTIEWTFHITPEMLGLKE